jgi:hypothetical protein
MFHLVLKVGALQESTKGERDVKHATLRKNVIQKHSAVLMMDSTGQSALAS